MAFILFVCLSHSVLYLYVANKRYLRTFQCFFGIIIRPVLIVLFVLGTKSVPFVSPGWSISETFLRTADLTKRRRFSGKSLEQ